MYDGVRAGRRDSSATYRRAQHRAAHRRQRGGQRDDPRRGHVAGRGRETSQLDAVAFQTTAGRRGARRSWLTGRRRAGHSRATTPTSSPRTFQARPQAISRQLIVTADVPGDAPAGSGHAPARGRRRGRDGHRVRARPHRAARRPTPPDRRRPGGDGHRRRPMAELLVRLARHRRLLPRSARRASPSPSTPPCPTKKQRREQAAVGLHAQPAARPRSRGASARLRREQRRAHRGRFRRPADGQARPRGGPRSGGWTPAAVPLKPAEWILIQSAG